MVRSACKVCPQSAQGLLLFTKQASEATFTPLHMHSTVGKVNNNVLLVHTMLC